MSKRSDLIADHRTPESDSLAEVDLAILRELSADARISNRELAERVGIAPSTCSGRVSALRRRGVIRGFHADIDLEALGLHVFGMISVRMTPVGRASMAAVIERLLAVPETLEVFQVSGERDLLVHIATTHPLGLHAFIDEHLADQAIAHTQTSLVFGHHRG
ncbi:Lrp/AsnC family transcriptional regulator [Brevibacterium casei]|uniref:AsnC family transcriptional regulator n=1 Tax=Brevibacterium casei TaxID=33889 RepID=A0A269ZGG2_9MICO|nr:Lrp/AsnC family transcriptional regulator [Brevibacterium casei]PAK96729.1 AsnC family transcriptional regulator [Brevibacterium casei]QPS34348.1 Lrp/AsnC family transcriptional regulator [Brevibacterium casei]